MAARFWVGGTGTWDSTTTANWSATSGGAGGASVPGAADDVTINTASITVTTNYNVSVISVTINASAATLSLGGTLTCSGAITLTTGTFTTNNFNVTATQLSSSNSNTRTINLGSSTVTLTTTATAVNTGTNTSLTFNAGTSTIICSGSNAVITGGISGGGSGLTFNNVSITSTTAQSFNINSSNTFNNLTVTAPASAGVTQIIFDSRQTINGTLSTTGTAGNRRVWFRGLTYGLAQTLTINSAPSLTDADFRDIYVIGTSAPISGTRIGNLRGCRGITFDTPKTVYWSSAAGGTWSATNWSATSGGGTSNDNFPLAQDTAVIENTGLNTSATVTLNATLPFIGTLDMSTRTNAATISISSGNVVYGNLVTGSGITYSGAQVVTFSGSNTQTITSAGKTFSGGITVDSYGGSIELADALNIGSQTLTVTNGTFDTKNYNVTALSWSSNNSNVRTINLGSSTLTFSGTNPIGMATTTNLTFNSGTSTIVVNSGGAGFFGAGLVWYNVNLSSTGAGTKSVTGTNTFNNFSIGARASDGITDCTFASNQTITGTLTVAGSSAVRRNFLRSDTLGTTRTLTVGTLSATDCDFRDITIAGTAAGSSPTRAGDCGGNTGITFPAAKTVYWNLAGAQNWSATAWAPGSGGIPDINNFPLAQDTAVFDNTGAVTGNISINANWNIGTFDASGRTSAMTLTNSGNSPLVYGDWKFGTGVSSVSTTGAPTFSGRGTQTLTSNGVTFGCGVTIDCATGTVQLADALTLNSARTLTLTSGTFDAVTYNVTTGSFVSAAGTLKMGSGTWTLSGTSTVWSPATGMVFYKSTANIVLSDTSVTARIFSGAGFSYNKLTIGGTTGISTLTISGNNQFTELASTKTVAHTIALGTTTQTFGKWTVTGTVGNVVTLTGTGTSHILAGACTDSIDYLAMGSIGFAATSPGEFYAGANSTGTAAAPVYRTAKPADSTRYWVGGTGNWSDTARWSTSSGGGSGASVPRSHDDVVFDSLSNATAYTATVNAVTGGIRTKALTVAGPLTGNLTLAGSTAMVGIHGNVTLPATGLTRTYTGAMTLSSNSTGRTFTTNGVTLASDITINGVDCGWSLGSALNIGSSGGLTVTNGSFDFATYNLTAASISSDNGNSRTIDFDTGTLSFSGATSINFGTTETNRANLTVTASTSQINISTTSPTFTGNNQTFYNVAFTSTTNGTITINGANSFNNLSSSGSTDATPGYKQIVLAANQTVTGTLTFSAGTDAPRRHFVRSDTIGTTRTITTAAFSGTDVDFRDITIAGAAAPVSGTRLGDAKGNSGITFTAAANKYWVNSSGGNWSANTNWALSSGGGAAANNFPLPQDTAYIESGFPNSGQTITINQSFNIGTIDMSARTTNTMTLATGSTTPQIYGNWINGTGTTLTGTGVMTFAGRGSQTITSAGRSFSQPIAIDTPGGSVTLQDAYTTTSDTSTAINILSGTFSANVYNVTLSGGSSGFTSANNSIRTIAIGSGTWTVAGTNGWNAGNQTNLTITGTGTISLSSGFAKSFLTGNAPYTNLTLNQGGNGTLTISGNSTFKTISSTAAGANTINIGTTTQRITTSWTAAGTAGNILTVQGTSASSPGTLVFTGSGTAANVDYLAITGVRAYNLDTTWYAGANSTNNGSLGWDFNVAPAPPSAGNFNFFLLF